jgi:hypothetical protein
LLLCHNVGQEEVICMFTPFVLGNWLFCSYSCLCAVETAVKF